MKFFTPIVLVLLVFTVLPNILIAQCSTTPCPPGQPMWDQDPMLACIAANENELDCFSGTMPNGGVINAGPPTWCTTVENNIFFAFTASASTVSFDIAVTSCSSGNGLQAAILSTTNCIDFSFVSNCVGNINQGTSAVITNNVPLTPGTVYFLMIDGQAGAICDFSINGGLPSAIPGQNVCIGANPIGVYTNTANATWSINPPNAGVFQGPNVNVNNVTIQWTIPGVHEVCAVTCPGSGEICVEVTVGQVANVTVGPEIICEGDLFACGGSVYTNTGVYTNVLVGPDGCDSIVTCIVEAVPTQYMPPQFVAICELDEHFICGQGYSSTGSYTEVCTGFLGCDSIVTVNLEVLDPSVEIEPPIETGCGASWSAILSAANSNWIDPPAQHTVLWTGPGIVGDDDQPVITVNVPGTYCFNVQHTLYGTTCEAEDCITVQPSLIPTNPPTVSGPTLVCGGFANYVASPNGGGAPDGFTWTTPNGEPFTVVNFFTIQVDWNGSPGGQLCVSAYNACGQSTPTCITVNVGGAPDTPIITGPDEVCEGSVQTYTLTNPSPGATCTWTVPPGASFSQTDTTIVVDFDGASSGNVCITCMDQCGTTPEVCMAVTVNVPPAAPTFSSGPNQVCATEVANYCVSPVPDADSYTWTTPVGNFIDTTNCVDLAWMGVGGNVCVTANNECGSSPQTCMNVEIIASPTAVLSGTGAVCAGSGDTIEMTIILTGTAPWTVTYTIGGVLQAPIIDIQSSPYTLYATQIGTYALATVTDGGICQGTVSGSGAITENALPTADLSGSGDICNGSGAQINLTITLTGAAPWEVEYVGGNGNPSTLNINSSPFTLPIGQGNAGTITLLSVIDDNDCEGTVSGSGQVNVIFAPTVSMVSTICDATNTNYTVSFTISGGDSTTYSVTPNTGALVGNVFTSDIIPSGNGYSFVVTDVNDCNPVTVSDNIVVCNCTTAVGDMDQTTLDTCGVGPITGFIYNDTDQVLDGDDVLMFVLHSGSSADIVPPIFSITATPTATFDPATMTYGTIYYMSAVVGNGGGPQGIDLTDPCLAVAQGTPVIFYDIPTATMAGATEICEGESADLTFNLTGVSPWSVIINGQTVSNIFSSPHMHTVDPDITTTYVLTSVSDENCTNTATGSETITVNFAPTVSPAIVTCNGSGTAYTVCFDISGGDPSCYSITPMDGTLTGNTFCSNEIPDGDGYSFEVSDCNNCPSVIVANPLVDCSCISVAGNMTTDELDVCEDALAEPEYLGGEVLDANDALCFVLHDGSLPLTPIVTNSTASFAYDPATMTIGTTYFICPVVGNDDGSGCVDLADPCLSIGGCAEVTFRVIPTATLQPGNDICLGESANLSVTFTGSGPWTFTYEDDQGVQNTLQASNSPFTIPVTPSATTDYSLVSMVGKFCTGTVSGQATVTVHEAPQVVSVSADCNASATAFTLTIEVTGGDPATYGFTPNNGMLNGNIFTSNPYLNGDSYSFEIDDQYQCGPILVDGLFNCECLTDAGLMTPNLVGFCVDTLAQVSPANNFFLDPDDVLVYVLHTNSDTTLGNIIATNDIPEFDFDPANMSTGVTYYISSIAGNETGNGNVDLNDPCIDVSAGTPVVFNDLPTLAISGDATLCNGDQTIVTFTLTGVGPFMVTYMIDNVLQQPVPVQNPGTFMLPITPTLTTSYSLVLIEDLGTGCSNSATGTVDITVNEPVSAGDPYGDFEICDNTNFTISLFENLVGFEYGGTWTDDDGNTYPNGSLNTGILDPGTHTFTYTMTGTPPCPDDQVSVNVIIHPAPVADAGEDVTLDCDLTSTLIGGNGTTLGMTYEWEGNVSDPTIAQPNINEAGEYILTVTTPFDCVDQDTMYAFVSQGIPSPVVSVTDVSCFGMNDGYIQIDDITGGNPPYTCSFNGGPFSDNKLFQNLSPGSYSIVIEDASGCEATLNFNIAQPEEVSVEIETNVEVEVEGDPVIAEYDVPIIIEIITNPPFADLDTVIWSSSTQTDSLCGNCEFNELALQFQTTFTVQIVENGCPDEDVLTVFVERDHFVYIPNAFSPNNQGDERNNTFKIYGASNVAKVKAFEVYSRWGETVYQYYNFTLDDPEYLGWDGKHRGELMNPAVFTWHAEVEYTDGVVRQYKGDVSLLR